MVQKYTSEYSSRISDYNSTISRKTSRPETLLQQFEENRRQSNLMIARSKPARSQIGRGYYNMHNPLIKEYEHETLEERLLRKQTSHDTIPIPIKRIRRMPDNNEYLLVPEVVKQQDTTQMVELDNSMKYLNKLKKESSQKFIEIIGQLSDSSKKLLTPKKGMKQTQSKTPDLMSTNKEMTSQLLLTTENSRIRSNIITREKSANNLAKQLSSVRLHNDKIKTMLKASQLAKLNSRNKDLNIKNAEPYYTQALNKKISLKNFGFPSQRKAKQHFPFDTPYATNIIPSTSSKKLLKKNHSKLQLRKAMEQLEQYDLIDTVQRDLMENYQMKPGEQQKLQSLSPHNSFEVLPDKASDDERMELKRFTGKNQSGKSLIIDDYKRNLKNSKKSSVSLLEDVTRNHMRRSSETQKQIRKTLSRIDTPKFSDENSQITSPSRLNLSPEEQIKLALESYQQYDFEQRFIHNTDSLLNHNATLGIIQESGRLKSFQLPLSKIHRLHPIFSKLSKEGAKMIIRECCQILFLRKNQILYTEGDMQTNIYIPLYGQIRLWSKKRGIITKSLGLGKTLGEEALCDCYYLSRTDSAFVLEDTAVLCIDRDEWIAARERLLQKSLIGHNSLISPVIINGKGAQGLNKFDKVIRDINQLDEIFRLNFYQKRKVKVTGYRGAVVLPKIKYGYSHFQDAQQRIQRLQETEKKLKVNFLNDSRNYAGNLNRTFE